MALSSVHGFKLFQQLLNTPSNNFDVEVDEIQEDHPRATQPENINVVLKPHQLSLIFRCIQYENEKQLLHQYKAFRPYVSPTDGFTTHIGIIGDRVGSGKSYVILSIILTNNIVNRDTNYVTSTALNNVTFTFENKQQVFPISMIVIPHNLASQWKGYMQAFGGNLGYTMINKRKQCDTFINTPDIHHYLEGMQVILVTAPYYNDVTEHLCKNDVRIRRVFFDEVDNLNIRGNMQTNANFLWFVTASYGNLLYPGGYATYDATIKNFIHYANGIRHTGFIKNICDDLYRTLPKDFTKVLVIKNSESFIEASLQLPSIKCFIIKCKTPRNIDILNGIVDRNIIESLNACDVNAAISYINPNMKGSEDNIISVLVTKYAKELTNLELRLNMLDEFVYDDERDRQKDRLLLERTIEGGRQKSSLLQERVRNSKSCFICYDDINNKAITNCCQNAFCFGCIMNWLSHKAVCPLCKSTLISDDLYVVSTEENETSLVAHDENETNEAFCKLKNLEILLAKKKMQGKKILLFSSYEASFTTIIPILRKLAYKYDSIKGNGDQINGILNRYKGDALDLLLVNTRSYGIGLNLENTTDIIMFHKFDTQLETQVIGRAQRPGRKTSLEVHYLVHQNEIK